MWDSKEENLNKELGGSDWINKSGVYAGKIIGAEVVNSNQTSAKAIKFTIETDNGKCGPTFWFKKSDGSENNFAIEKLDRIKFLCKIKEIKIKKDEEKTILPDFLGKEIGIFLEVKKQERGLEYEVKDFFEVNSKKTSDEILGKKENNKFKYWTEKFSGSEPIKKEITNKKESSLDDDEFPF